MNKIFKTLAVTALTFSTNSAVMANNDPIDFSALTGEYVSTNPGLEIAVPSWTRVDNNSDGKIDGYDFHFDVYKLGTKTQLFSTPVQYLPYFLSACTRFYPNGKNIDFKRISSNVVLSASLTTGCGSKEKLIGHVYAVNISAAGKTPWVKSFSGRLLGTGILPDKNGNGIGELSVILETGVPNEDEYSEDPIYSDNIIYVYDGETGASLATPQKYAIQR